MKIRRLLAALLTVVAIPLMNGETALGRPLPKRPVGDTSLTGSLDAMLASLTPVAGPGFAVGVIRRGRLVYSKGFGLANIESGLPITPESPFYIASASKQFTAACAVLLIERGQLRLTDDVRKYIPELPDYGHKLTIDHLIHHTGGVREWTSLLLFRGEDDRFEQRVDNSDVIELLLRQKNLEFEPGSEYRYSSAGYILLTEVIERVTGKTLRVFAQQEIFTPLGMNDTRFEDNYAEILPNRVISYRLTENGKYERYLKHFSVYGDGGVVTSVEDMAKWDSQLRANSVGGERFNELLITRGELNDGQEIPYAFGLERKVYRGHRTIEHNGGMLGFRTDFVRFPDQEVSIVVLGNSQASADQRIRNRIADQILPSASVTWVKPRRKKLVDAAVRSPDGILGNYWIESMNMYRRVVLQGDQLMLDWGPNTGGDALVAETENRYRVERNDESIATVEFTPKADEGVELYYSSGSPAGGFTAFRYDPTPPESTEELLEFVGTYYSEELDATYDVTVTDNSVFLKMGEARARRIFPPEGSIVWNSKDMVWVRFGEIVFRRNSEGRVWGLSIGDTRVSRVDFVRI